MTAVVMLERAPLLLLRTKYCRHPSVDAVTTVIPLVTMIAGFRLTEQTLLKPRTLARMLLLLLETVARIMLLLLLLLLETVARMLL